VLGELKRHLRDSSWAAHVPRRVQERVMQVTSAMDDLSSRQGRSPTVAEIARATEYSAEEVLEAMDAAQAYQSRPLEGPGFGDDDDDHQDALAELGRREIGYEVVELGASVRPTVESMPDRDREILRLRFVEDLTQSQIAERVGISQMHVSRLIRSAVERLEKAVGDDAGASAAVS
jgi:RNA polymerase sigma-B factor